jgi:hypothetical protein
MFTVVHEGTSPDETWPALVEEIGPNGARSTTQRLEPGYLGGLLLSQPDADRPGGRRFFLIDMWDERYAGPSTVSQPIRTSLDVDWLRPPSAFSAIR